MLVTFKFDAFDGVTLAKFLFDHVLVLLQFKPLVLEMKFEDEFVGMFSWVGWVRCLEWLFLFFELLLGMLMQLTFDFIHEITEISDPTAVLLSCFLIIAGTAASVGIDMVQLTVGTLSSLPIFNSVECLGLRLGRQGRLPTLEDGLSSTSCLVQLDVTHYNYHNG
jgi:hypothetical protein